MRNVDCNGTAAAHVKLTLSSIPVHQAMLYPPVQMRYDHGAARFVHLTTCSANAMLDPRGVTEQGQPSELTSSHIDEACSVLPGSTILNSHWDILTDMDCAIESGVADTRVGEGGDGGFVL